MLPTIEEYLLLARRGQYYTEATPECEKWNQTIATFLEIRKINLDVVRNARNLSSWTDVFAKKFTVTMSTHRWCSSVSFGARDQPLCNIKSLRSLWPTPKPHRKVSPLVKAYCRSTCDATIEILWIAFENIQISAGTPIYKHNENSFFGSNTIIKTAIVFLLKTFHCHFCGVVIYLRLHHRHMILHFIQR